MTQSPFVNEVEAAAYLGLSSSTLNRWRVECRGPRFRKFGSKVAYAITDLNDYAAEATVFRQENSND